MAITKKAKEVDYEVTHTRELLGEDGEGTGVIVTLRSEKCKDAVSVGKRIAASLISMEFAQRGGLNDAASEKWLDKHTELQIERYVAVTAGIEWNGQELFEGAGDLAVTPENMKVIMDFDFVREQWDAWIKELSDFTKA